MESYKTETTLKPDGSLVLDNLPFSGGERVEVTVTVKTGSAAGGSNYPLRGRVIRFDQPTAPVAEGDWEAGS